MDLPEHLLKQIEHHDSVARGLAAQEIGKHEGERASQALRVLLQDPDPIVCFKAAQELAFRKEQSGLNVLLWAMGKRELCFLALQALAQLASIESVPFVRRFFHKWFIHPLERMQAAAVLHCCGDTCGTEYLRKKLDSIKAEERGFALELWGKLKMPDSLNFLSKIAESPKDAHRLDAVRGLGCLGDKKCIPLLKRLANQDPDSELVRLANETISFLQETTS